MKEASDPKLDGFMRLEDIVPLLAGQYQLRAEGDTGYDSPDYYVTATAGKVRRDTVQRLLDEGWIEGRNGSFRLTDAGRCDFLRSTDELGDGKLIPPAESEPDERTT